MQEFAADEKLGSASGKVYRPETTKCARFWKSPRSLLLTANPWFGSLSYPKLKIAGVAAPMIDRNDSEGCEAVAKMIKDSGADLLVAALGSPKQETFLGRHLDQFGCKVVIGVGATLDFISGRVKRAPVIWQKLSAEWLYRFLMEPRRLAGRYARDLS